MHIFFLLIFSVLLMGTPAHATAGDFIVRESEPSLVMANNTRLVVEMNHFIATTIGTEEEHVGVYFVPFQNETASGFPFLADLQAGERWSADRRKSSLHFLGWTYTERHEGRRVVQMDPELVRKYYTRDPYGMFTIPSSSLWYAMGHELAHVHLYAKGVPEEDHHCYMVETGIVQKLIEYLSARDALAFSQFAILRGEIATCENQKREKRERATGSSPR